MSQVASSRVQYKVASSIAVAARREDGSWNGCSLPLIRAGQVSLYLESTYSIASSDHVEKNDILVSADANGAYRFARSRLIEIERFSREKSHICPSSSSTNHSDITTSIKLLARMARMDKDPKVRKCRKRCHFK